MKTIKDKLLALADAKTMHKLRIYGFDLAYEEAEFLGLPKEGELFDKMVKIRTNAVIYNVYRAVCYAAEKHEEFRIIIPRDDELPEIVRGHYKK